jgi:transposase
MTNPYSLDLRERVVASLAEGRTCRATAALFRVSVASVVKWSQRDRATGSPAAKPMGRRNRELLLMPERDWLMARFAATPDLTLEGIRAELAERGVVVSYTAVRNFFLAQGLTFKKKPARNGAGQARRGAQTRTVEAASGKA